MIGRWERRRRRGHGRGRRALLRARSTAVTVCCPLARELSCSLRQGQGEVALSLCLLKHDSSVGCGDRLRAGVQRASLAAAYECPRRAACRGLVSVQMVPFTPALHISLFLISDARERSSACKRRLRAHCCCALLRDCVQAPLRSHYSTTRQPRHAAVRADVGAGGRGLKRRHAGSVRRARGLQLLLSSPSSLPSAACVLHMYVLEQASDPLPRSLLFVAAATRWGSR